MAEKKEEKPPQIETNQLQLQIQGLTQMVERLNFMMGSIHERLERVERRGTDEKCYRAYRDGNHVRRHKRHISPVVDIGFDVIGDEDDDITS
ncbi:hypothetical protein POTOM_047405 [Populus tomentosa]|uniref:Uncharacterized protein n=1 Tax=Populus tomentosa TaxID=118781 RepID=A0A8X7YGN8_POPTO|nr:hypothetical protein POTOM_047405 [Populus tomentosa]